MNKRGFTLIETLVVVAIIAALAVMIFGVYPRIKASQMKNIVNVNVDQILAGVERYETITGTVPQSQTDFEALLLNMKYFESVPQNPYWNDNKTHPEKGWTWDSQTQGVTSILH